jgi:endonuclease/exonuclease/phosphatase family metal-dependent hydrolase
METIANAYGYTNETTNRVELIFTKTKIHDNTSNPEMKPDSRIKLLTYNTWTTKDIPYSRYLDRIEPLCKILLEEDPDIIFLQEVGINFLNALKENKFIVSKYFFSECDVYNGSDDWGDAITLILAKERMLMSTYNIITGDHKYSFTIAETDRFFLINCYLHAGSRFSPGITFHQKYHEYRKEQLKIIHDTLQKLNIGSKQVIFGGDFNLDLGDDKNEFPELSRINEFNLVDCWKKVHHNKKGYTEDTDINTMRWNLKQQVKKFRYDGFFCSPKWSVNSMEIIGTKPVFKTKFTEELQIPCFANHVKKANLKMDLMKLTDGYFEWFASDHFGVTAEISIE